MRVYLSERDNFILKEYLNNKQGIEVISFRNDEKNVFKFVDNLVKRNIDIVVQIAPQWEWGKYVEQISSEIMDKGIKLLTGEGAMFRWFGSDYNCGSDIGFYLSPWGISGNSKIAYEFPKPTFSDIHLAKKIRSYIKKWNSKDNNGKILIIGQLNNDRSRFYCGKIKSNEELVEECKSLFGKKSLIYRKHPKDRNKSTFGIKEECCGGKLKDIICKYYTCISINSTSTIEAICSGTPVINDGFAPWSGAGSIIQKLSSKIIEYEYDEYLLPIASLIHLHYLPSFNHGDPFKSSLDFYSKYIPNIFRFNCIKYSEEPEIWKAYIY